MTTVPRTHSRAITSYSQLSSNVHHKKRESFQLKQFWLRKSMFSPPPGLAQTFAARRHLAGVEVPKVEIIHCSPRWLLLQAPQAKSNFFESLKKGKLGRLEQQILKLFKSFVCLTKSFGFFRPTQKMIFLEREQIRVWISEDIFSNTPSMPIHQGKDRQKHFVIAFLAMVSTSLENWQIVSNIVTIQQTIEALRWRCKIERADFLSEIHVTQNAYFKPEEFQALFDPSELVNTSNTINSQQLDYKNPLQNTKPLLSNSQTLNQAGSFPKAKDLNFAKKSSDYHIEQAEQQNSIRHTKKKFGLHTTSSSLGNFSQKYRSTVGKKKHLEKTQKVQQPQAPQVPMNYVQTQPSIQTEFDDLFADEWREGPEGYDQAQLQRIAEQMEQVLIQ